MLIKRLYFPKNKKFIKLLTWRNRIMKDRRGKDYEWKELDKRNEIRNIHNYTVNKEMKPKINKRLIKELWLTRIYWHLFDPHVEEEDMKGKWIWR